MAFSWPCTEMTLSQGQQHLFVPASHQSHDLQGAQHRLFVQQVLANQEGQEILLSPSAHDLGDLHLPENLSDHHSLCKIIYQVITW